MRGIYPPAEGRRELTADGTWRLIGDTTTARIAELEAEVARLTAINADLCVVNLRHAEDFARIAELEAERDRQRSWEGAAHVARAQTAIAEGERDRLAAALTKIVNDEEGDYDLLAYIARAALSGEGVTK